MNKSFLFVIMLLAASFTGCIDSEDSEDSLTEPVGEVNVPGNALVFTRDADATECSNGGITLDVGVDEDGDGKLNSTETFNTSTICNGANGIDGNDGSSCSAYSNGNGTYTVSCDDGTNFTVSDGDKGDSGQDITRSEDTLLTDLERFDFSPNCNLGGKILSYGLDNGDGSGISANGLLELGEIDSTSTFCTNKHFGLLMDISPGGDSSQPAHITKLDDHRIVFSANDGVHGREIWVSNLSDGSTKMLKNIFDETLYPEDESKGSFPDTFTLFNGEIFFIASSYRGEGHSIWKTDGTTEGTVLVYRPCEGKYSWSPQYLTVFNDELYFQGGGCESSGQGELWKTDGTSQGTVLIKDINENSSSQPSGFVATNNQLYFTANDGSGIDFWKTDGTKEGTIPVPSSEDYSFYWPLASINNDLYFEARLNGVIGLWKTNGTDEGTFGPYTDASGQHIPSNPSLLTEFDGQLYFVAETENGYMGLWRLNESGDHTDLVTNDIYDIEQRSLIVNDNKLYFMADPQNRIGEDLFLYTFDGNDLGLFLHVGGDLIGTNGKKSIYSVDGDNRLYFYLNSVDLGMELFYYDVGKEEIYLTGDLHVGTLSSYACCISDGWAGYSSNIVTVGPYIISSAHNEITGHEIYYNYAPKTEIYLS